MAINQRHRYAVWTLLFSLSSCSAFTVAPGLQGPLQTKIRSTHSCRRLHVFDDRQQEESPFDFLTALKRVKPFDKSTKDDVATDAVMNAQARRFFQSPGTLFSSSEPTQPQQVVTTTTPASMDTETLIAVAATLFVGAGAALLYSLGFTASDVALFLEHLVSSPQDTLQDVIQYVQSMGPLGVLYFGVIYLVAELLAVPATPLTLSAGYLFGLSQGTAVVLLAATIASSIAFCVGKTFLRSWVEKVLEENPDFAKIDRAVGRDGFKLLLLIRLSPIFPFALSNYLYGASSIDFVSYFFGTLLGFTPGTIAYVYTGMVGKALTMGGGEAQPWYVYAGGFAALLTFLKLATDVASNVVNAIEDEDEELAL